MFDTIEGKAICNICLSMEFISNVLFKRTQRYAEKEKTVGKINYISTFIY